MVSTSIIGRQKEIVQLQRIYNSDKPEFVAIYGRRRVGKSYLIDEAFKGRFAFNAVGIFHYSTFALSKVTTWHTEGTGVRYKEAVHFLLGREILLNCSA